MQGRSFRQNQNQDRIWLLAGTGDGPRLAAALGRHGWQVTVSVVTAAASRPYAGLGLERITVGPLQGREAIVRSLQSEPAFRWVVDATHPFASQISADLKQACVAADQPLLRFERPLEFGGTVRLLNGLAGLGRCSLDDQRVFLAIGGRHLPRAHAAAHAAGAEVFARCLPSADGLRQALAAGLPQNHLAVLRPLQGDVPGDIERALCRRWCIDSVVCRQSGGVTERLWRDLSGELDLTLLLLRRPAPPAGVVIVNSEEALLRCLAGTHQSPVEIKP